MSDINTVNLFNQMHSMAAKAEGTNIESEGNQLSFNSVFMNALNQVNDLDQNANSLKTRYEFKDPDVSIGEVMIATQKADIGLQAALRVRNKMVQFYQDIMSMPV